MPGVGGDIELMSVSDIALWIAGRKATGTLTVRRVGIEARFTIREGHCMQAASTDPREYLGQHLINFGHINEEQLQQAFDTQKETKVPLGRILVMVELLTMAQLQTVIFFKTREGFLEALGWHEGSWRFVPETDTAPELDSERPVDLREAVSEAAARQQMWGEIRRVFPSDGTRCDVVVDPATVESAFDRRLLELMARGVSVGEAALELRAMDFQVYARLYDLANRQLVRPVLTATFRIPRSATPMAATSPLAAALAAAAPLLSTPTSTPTPPPGPAPPRTATPAPALFPFPSAAHTAPAAPTGSPPGTASTTVTLPRTLTPPSPPPVLAPPAPALFPLPFPGATAATAATAATPKGPAFSSGFAVGRIAPAPPATSAPSPSPTPSPSPPPPAPPPAPSAAPTPVARLDDLELKVEVDDEPPPPRWSPPPAPPAAPPPRAGEEDGGFGTYMMVKKPAAVENPIKALEMALAGRNWAEALLLAQRILEHDPHDSEAIAALRVADAQLRKQEKTSGPTDADFARVPRLTAPLAEMPAEHLTSKERYVLSRIDGQRSLAKIAAVSPVQRAELWRIVESFVQQGVLTY